MLMAITREISPSLGRCELTHLERTPIDLDKAVLQHAAYEKCLRDFGFTVQRAASLPDLPDSVFVEDTCVVLDELAVITRPGAGIRRRETESIADAVRPFRALQTINAPGTLDGGDVLRLGKRLFVGLSSRTNHDGIKQLEGLIAPYGYTVTAVSVTGCLHLKSAVTQVAEDHILLNPQWVDAGVFNGYQVTEVDPSELHGANSLHLGGALIYPEAFPRTRERLERVGIRVLPVDLSELAKAEGAVTCCSLLLN
jgi:dimethylargininase